MLKQELEALKLQGEIEDDQATLDTYSHDASLFEVRPEVVVFPKNVEDLKKIVKFCGLAKKLNPQISITARSAGTDMSGGPLNQSIILSFTKYFNRIIEVGADFAVAEPGVFYRDFEKETLKKGLLLPPYPASRELCTIGGMVANNSAGEKTLTYGKVENYVEELNVILADGNEYLIKALSGEELKAKCQQQNFEGAFYRQTSKLIEENYEIISAAKPRVSKNSAGYFLWNVWDKEKNIFDLTKLFVGSQGTLGLITKIKFRLIKPQQKSQMLVIFMKSLKDLAEIVNEVLAFKPESFESYDDKTLKLALKFFPEMLKAMKTKNLLKLAFGFLPEVGMVLRGGLPKLILMAEFRSDDENKARQQALAAQKALKKYGLLTRISDQEDSEKYWTIRRESFNLLRKHMHGKRTAPFIDDFVIQPQFLPEFLPKLNKILSQYDLVYTIAGHIGNGNFHIIPLMDFKDPKSREIIAKLSDEVYDLVLSYEGSITAEHNDGLIRSPYLKQMYGPKIYSFFEEIKKIFDPENLFNPGKKVNSSMQYSLEHIVKTS